MKDLSHYRILEEISRGGMGIVYRALDLKLNREVALKLLSPELVADGERKERFVREARAAAALKHPNVAVIYEIDEDDDTTFISMELIEGESLAAALQRGRLPAERALEIALDVARGLASAHEKGVLHRDLKPANIVLTSDGRPKIVDFGLAKLLAEPRGGDSELVTVAKGETEPGRILGTVAYMSPEQARGEKLDARSDVFSFGIVLHELLTGSPPFRGPSAPETLSAIINEPHPSLPRDRTGTKRNELQKIVDCCLEKAPSDRYPSMTEVVRALEQVQSSSPSRRSVALRWVSLATVLALVSVLAWLRFTRDRSDDVEWALEDGLLELERRVDQDDYAAAFELATRLKTIVPDDPSLAKLWPKLASTLTVSTAPEGANVSYRSVSAPTAPWEPLGASPVTERAVPNGAFWLMVEKAGFDTVESMFFGKGPYAAADKPVTVNLTLNPEGTAPPRMVPVPAGTLDVGLSDLDTLEPVESSAYWIDEFEVTNVEYKAFVDEGAYRDRELWHHPFRNGERELEWSEAMALFHDQTGRPGPSTWEVGTYPEGRGEEPVSGVSWFEAAAYCEHTGKALPTVYHWSGAADPSYNEIIPTSNFGGSGLLPVGSGPPGFFGTHDMAGNAKEWCWNEADGLRYILGGAWNEPTYMFYEADAQPPFTRLPSYGFRCVKLEGESGASLERMKRPIPLPSPVMEGDPVSDEVFEAYRALFTYDPVPLDARVLETDESDPRWKREKIAFRAAYADEDVLAYLFLPTSALPPFQTVVYFPGASAQRQRSPEELQTRMIDFLVLSGRAVMYPIYEGTHERRTEPAPPEDSRSFVDYTGHLVSDLERSIDYLATRDDVQIDKLGYYGFSWGAGLAPIFLALEPRFEAAVLLDGGLYAGRARPEVSEWNYAPRVRLPVLMVNGERDVGFPLETSQKVLFGLLGTPPEHKEHKLYPAGHAVFVRYRNQAIENILDWFDRYLGPAS